MSGSLRGSAHTTPLARNLREFDVARSEKLEVNPLIALDIRTLSSQSERAKNTIHRFSVHLFQLRFLQRRMMHDPCFIARGTLLL